MNACYQRYLQLFVITAVLLISGLVFAKTTENVGSDQVSIGVQTEKGPHILINVAARRLLLYEDDKFVKSYPIAVGMSIYPTPLGRRYLTQIVWNPWWIPPKESAWAAGAVDTPPGPQNPLGPVKMKLGSAIMIHGTNKPSSVGKAASHGCMRMYSQDALELARWIQEKITDQNSSEVFDKYNENKSRSYYVQLENTVPVDIFYDPIHIYENTLYVFQDVYHKYGNKLSYIKAKIKKEGYDVDGYDWKSLDKEIKIATKLDVKLDLNQFRTNHKKKKDTTDTKMATVD